MVSRTARMASFASSIGDVTVTPTAALTLGLDVNQCDL